MNLFKRMVVLLGLALTLTVPVPVSLLAQTATNAYDGTILKQVIVFGRHGIRSTTTDSSVLSQVAVDSYPAFEVPKGYLTPNGRRAEILLGTYFRNYLLYQGLLTYNDQDDAAHVYCRANSIQRSNVTAAAFLTGLLPSATPVVHSYPLGQGDPIFDPVGTYVAEVDPVRAATETRAIFTSGTALTSAYSGELSLLRSVLFDYTLGTQPPPDTPQGLFDPTVQAIPLTANTGWLQTGDVINIAGLEYANMAADPFVMQYADGFPMDQVGWGRLSVSGISQLTRLISYTFNIEMLSPYLNKVQSSNAAAHVLRTMEQVVTGFDVPGAFGDAGSRTVVIISSDGYVAGLAGLLRTHWQLPGYQPDFCAPGGVLVFELRQSITSGEYLVRVFYTAQTFDQLRNLTTLNWWIPPATMQLLIPGGSKSATDLDVDFDVFKELLTNAIDWDSVQDPSQEIPPWVLTGVPLE